MNEECEQQQQHSSSNNNNNNNNRSRQTGKAVTILYISFHFKLFTKKLYSENRVKESVANIIHTTVNNKMFGWCVMCVCVVVQKIFFFWNNSQEIHRQGHFATHTHTLQHETVIPLNMIVSDICVCVFFFMWWSWKFYFR